MKLLLKNETRYEPIIINHGTHSHSVKRNETIEIFVDSSDIELLVYLPEENTVTVNWLFALIDGFISEESIICSFNCNFRLTLNPTMDIPEVVFKDIVARDDKNGYIYNSAFAQTKNAEISNIKYTLHNTGASRKKAMLYYIFLTSSLPILLYLLYESISTQSVLAIIGFLAVLIILSIPSWKKAIRLKQFFTDEKATELIQNEYYRLESNNWNEITEPNNFIEKSIFKILDFIFGKNKRK